ILERDPALATETGKSLFAELEAAMNCLSDPQQKQAYDARLREERTGKRHADGALGGTSNATQYDSQLGQWPLDGLPLAAIPTAQAQVAASVEPAPAQLVSIEPASVIVTAQDKPAPFDPYRAWLGIDDRERPLNYYVLLGLTPYEGDL